ncbi:MAG: acyl-CoA dehydrogenase family protein [Microbacteriaceae bacterium]
MSNHLSDDEQMLVDTVRAFIDRDVKPTVNEVEHANEYPEAWIEAMKEMGIFGLAVPEEYDGLPVSMPAYIRVTEELARGWMSLAGAMGGHTVVAKLLTMYGTEEQKQKYLPLMATGELRATMALTEPNGGSDLQAITTTAKTDGDDLVINGSKTWISNVRRSGLVAVLVKTDPAAEPRHTGMSIVLVEPGDGFSISRDLPKMGYKGVESCEISFDNYRTPSAQILGGEPGKGFAQFMKGLEVGRIQVASRSLGVATAALEDSLQYAQERETFGKPIWKHQSVGNYLADMATKLTAARQLTLFAAEKYESGERCDMEAGMAKLFASEVAQEIALNAIRIHGGYGYSTEYNVERYYRDAPLMIVGEGTNEIQKNVIAAQLVARGGL